MRKKEEVDGFRMERSGNRSWSEAFYVDTGSEMKSNGKLKGSTIKCKYCVMVENISTRKYCVVIFRKTCFLVRKYCVTLFRKAYCMSTVKEEK